MLYKQLSLFNYKALINAFDQGKKAFRNRHDGSLVSIFFNYLHTITPPQLSFEICLAVLLVGVSCLLLDRKQPTKQPKQIYKWADKQVDKKTDRQTDKQANKQADKPATKKEKRFHKK